MRYILSSIIKINIFFVTVILVCINSNINGDTNIAGLKDDNCLTCHTEEESLPEGFHENDIHMQSGLSCAGCHGGDPTSDDMDDAMSESMGFVGVPTKKDIPQFCGKCHSDIDFMRKFQPRIPTDQVDQYYTSIHGQQLKKGDTRVADCTSCHTSHGILPAKDSRSSVYPLNVPNTCNHCHGDTDHMNQYNIPTNQYEQYAQSVHGKALLENQDTGAPACNDCHGNHGAMPPGIASITHVCGTCHVNNMQYFSSSRMASAFEEDDLHACEECHGNHGIHETSDEMVGTGDDAICIDCHDEGDKGYEVAADIHLQLSQLTAAYDSAENKRTEVQRIGMDDVDIGFMMQEGHQNLIQSRTLVHTFDSDMVRAKSAAGLKKIQGAIQLADKEIHEFDIRRGGFGIATIFITILIVAIFFKLKEIEKHK